MRRPVRGAGAAIAALTAITIMAGGVAAAPTQTVRVGDLTVSHEPSGIAWLDGRRLHTPRGDVVRLPWTKKQVRTRHPRILGHRPHTWLVKDFTGDTWNVWAVSGGKRAKLFSVGIADGEEATIVVARDSRRIAVSDFDGSNSALLEVYNGRGDLVASRTFDGDGAVLDFSGPRAVVGTSDTQVWDIDSDSLTDLGVDASGASIDNDLLLVRDPVSGEVGPTPLDNPGTPAWTARMVEPRLTPGGGRLVSRADRFAQGFEIRAVSDGRVVQSFRVKNVPSDTSYDWADNHAFVFVGSSDAQADDERLVRCTVKGHCRAQSAVRPRKTLSIPPL